MSGRRNRPLFLDALLELLYPSQANCMGCSSALGADEGWLCAACAAKLKPMYERGLARCPRCGCPQGAGRCHTCGDWPQDGPSFARFAYPYAPPVDAMVRRMKYGGVYRMRGWMAQELSKVLAREDFRPFDCLAPVPMAARRKRARGFNQAEELARALAELTGQPMTDALLRERNTRQQAKLDAQARRRNLEGAFRAQAPLPGLRILLVDDVLTTGATACQCARALYRAGAADVQFIALAGSFERRGVREVGKRNASAP